MRYAISIIFCLSVELATRAVLRAEAPPYRVAVILPLSGQVASLGQYVKRGIDLGLESLPTEQRSKLDLVFEDDQFNPTLSISAYRKLKNSGRIDAVLVLGSPPANALVPTTEREKTLLIAIGASDPTIAVGKSYAFIHWVTPKALGERLAEELGRRALKRVAIVAAEVTGMVADADAAVAALKQRGRGATVVYYETFLKDVTDYRSALIRIRDKRADAVVAVLFPGALSAFAKQFRDMAISAELVGMETFEDDSEVKASQGALVGGWYVNASASTNDFASRYKDKYGEAPGWGAANSYDTIQLLGAAVARGALDNESVRKFLQSVQDFSGAAGVYSASGDNRFTLPATVKSVTSNGFTEGAVASKLAR